MIACVNLELAKRHMTGYSFEEFSWSDCLMFEDPLSDGQLFPVAAQIKERKAVFCQLAFTRKQALHVLLSLCCVPSLVLGPSFRLPECTEDQQLSRNPTGLPDQIGTVEASGQLPGSQLLQGEAATVGPPRPVCEPL